ncbi:TPA: cytoplasmic protein [Escherichia coli]|nr:cytoplasmic protein [Escherichia coli]TGX57347.1 cytoplasmic protein [Escherichia coli]HAW3725980.1 cytoplasmic protein [Escherichia coli]
MMDDERLKNPPVGSSVLERIRDIRASMRRVYLQVIFPLLTLSQLYRH